MDLERVVMVELVQADRMEVLLHNLVPSHSAIVAEIHLELLLSSNGVKNENTPLSIKI